MKKGFSLLEMLVALVIIGVLAAYAVSRYQLSADRARFAAQSAALDAISRAQQGYYYAAGRYTDDLDELASRVPLKEVETWTEGGELERVNGFYADKQRSVFYWLSLEDDGHSLTLQALPSTNNPLSCGYAVLLADGKVFARLCTVQSSDEKRGRRLCKALGANEQDGNFILEKNF